MSLFRKTVQLSTETSSKSLKKAGDKSGYTEPYPSRPQRAGTLRSEAGVELYQLHSTAEVEIYQWPVSPGLGTEAIYISKHHEEAVSRYPPT